MFADKARQIANENRLYPNESEEFAAGMREIQQSALRGRTFTTWALHGGANYYGGTSKAGSEFCEKLEKLGYKVRSSTSPEWCIANIYISWWTND